MFDPTLSLNGLRVLVVDNNLDSRDLLTILFKEYGIETITATSALKAREILEQVKPDLLISEIVLPNEDGYSLMSRVRKFEIARLRIPAIALTVYTREEDRAHALSVGFDEHLSKPFDINELIAMVACLTRQVQSMPAI